MAKDKDADGIAGEGKKGLLGGKLKLIIIILPVLLLVGGGAYFVFSGGKSADSKTSASAHKDCEEGDEECEEAAAEGEEETADEEEEEGSTPESTEKPGEVVTVDPVTINLAAGHYLKVGLAMQATADAGEHVPPGIAADALITQFSGKTVEELSTEEGREEAKKELLKSVKKLYHHKVYEIYYTTYVMN